MAGLCDKAEQNPPVVSRRRVGPLYPPTAEALSLNIRFRRFYQLCPVPNVAMSAR